MRGLFLNYIIELYRNIAIKKKAIVSKNIFAFVTLLQRNDDNVFLSNFSPQPYLTTEEEKQLVDFLITSSKMGYGKTRRQVLKIVEAAVWFASVSHGWWICFTEHWPNLSLCKGDRTWSWC